MTFIQLLVLAAIIVLCIAAPGYMLLTGFIGLLVLALIHAEKARNASIAASHSTEGTPKDE